MQFGTGMFMFHFLQGLGSISPKCYTDQAWIGIIPDWTCLGMKTVTSYHIGSTQNLKWGMGSKFGDSF